MKHPQLVDESNPVLRKICAKIAHNTDLSETLVIMNDVFDKTPTAVGLAAPQIGLDIQLFMTNYNGLRRVFINPEITHKDSFGVSIGFEGCLSLPQRVIQVPRSNEILVRFYDEKWDKYEEDFNLFHARIIQHEYDHLIGKLITDYSNAEETTKSKV